MADLVVQTSKNNVFDLVIEFHRQLSDLVLSHLAHISQDYRIEYIRTTENHSHIELTLWASESASKRIGAIRGVRIVKNDLRYGKK